MDKKKKQIFIGLGILIVLGVVAFIIWFAAKKKREKAEKETQEEGTKLSDTMLEEIAQAASTDMELRPAQVTEPVTEEPKEQTTDPLVRPLKASDLKPLTLNAVALNLKAR